MPGPLDRRCLLVAGLGLVAAAVVAACGGDDDERDAGGVVSLSDATVPADGPGIVLRPELEHPGRLVAMVGDSITVGATALLEDAAADRGIDLFIDGQVGRRITVGGAPGSGTRAVEDLSREFGRADLWVIALGTNDVGQYATREEYATQIQALLDLIPADEPLAWINVYLAGRAEQSALFNDALNELLAARGHATIGDWTADAAAEGVLSDGIHPSDEGRARFVEVVMGEIAKWM
jgi:lysophospholipase L1-like esterase